MAMNAFGRLGQLLNPLTAITSPLYQSQRWLIRWKRREFIRRFGYEAKIHRKGLLPRVKHETFPLSTVPIEPKPDPWFRRTALFGTNDYIDILGDGSIRPVDLQNHWWLRGFQGNEIQKLIRMKKVKSHWKWLRPAKWHDMNKRIDFLYKRLNFKKRPPPAPYPWNKQKG